MDGPVHNGPPERLRSHACRHSPQAEFGVSDEELAGLAGLALVARPVKFIGLPGSLARLVRLTCRRRSCRDDQLLLSPVYCLCSGGWHLIEWRRWVRTRVRATPGLHNATLDGGAGSA